jgi:general secretion pathway protein D
MAPRNRASSTDETGLSASLPHAKSQRVSLHRAQKANTLSMTRRFLFPLRNSAGAVAFAAVSILVAAPPAHAQSAATFSKRGAAAEVREDYDAAYENYKTAHDKKPKDLRYLAHFERMRFLAATQHIDRGRVLRQNGDFAGAMNEFMRAAAIDKSNQAATQEIQRTQREMPPPGVTGAAAVAQAEQMSQQNQVLKEINSIAPPIELKTVSSDMFSFHAVEDVKVIYQAIGKIAGLNCIFDPDYTSKRIPIDLTNVSVPEALRIVGTLAGTFYKPVTPNTIFIAQNTRTKHSDLDELSVQTFYLSNAAQATDGNEILTGLRLLLDPQVKLYLVPSQNAIVMRATTDQLLLAEKLINDFDRARPEVVVDVAVLEVNRDTIRNLGITLPQSIGLTPQLPTTTSSTTTTTTSTTNTSASLTLNNLAHLNATDFGVTVTGGTVNALLSDTDTRVLQNPRIRATDGQRATLKIGQKIPIATGSYNAGVSTGVASIGVQTQFTYLDVGVNIDITPTVHYDREVTLKTKVEVSQQNGSVTISNVTEPIIAQRVLEQQIQLKDGEPSILAGILTKQDNKSVSGTPGLGEIPFFKFFFASTNKEVQQDEIVFLLIPHIVRESVISRINLAAIDTGTLNSYDLRRDETPHPPPTPSDGPGLAGSTAAQPATTAAAAATAAIQTMQQQAMPMPTPHGMAGMPQAITSTQPANAPEANAFGPPPVSLSITPANSSQSLGSTFQVAVQLSGGQDIFSVPLQLQFDPHVLQLVNVDAGDFLARDGQPVVAAHRLDNDTVTISTSRQPNTKGISGQGNVCTLTFKAIAAGDTNLVFVKAGAKNSAQTAIAANGTPAVIHVK